MNINQTLFTGLFCLILNSALFAQTDKEQIASNRKASNYALKVYDHQKVLSYLTDDVLITTGNGTLLCGKEELQAYIKQGGDSKMYWVRDAQEIVVNADRGLAWERGVWHGYDPEKSTDAVINGNYSAMWVKESATWKIKSQLFVTLQE